MVAARLKPRGLPAHRAVALWALPPRLRRHVREGQRRHLPLLRLLRAAKARPQGLRRRAATEGQAGGRDPRPAHRALPARRPHPRRDRASRRQQRDRPRTARRTTRRRSPRRSPAPSARSSATRTPSRTAPSTPRASRSGYPRSIRAWTPSKPKTKHSHANSPQTRPQRPTRRHSTRSPTSSPTSSPTATPTKPRRCYASSSPTCTSTAATKSCPPTASAHPWFAHRQVQWSYWARTGDLRLVEAALSQLS